VKVIITPLCKQASLSVTESIEGTDGLTHPEQVAFHISQFVVPPPTVALIEIPVQFAL